MLNNLPFRAGEYQSAQLISSMMLKDALKATLNSKNATHSVAELYAQQSVKRFPRSAAVASSVCPASRSSLTSRQPPRKYLGVRAYFVDSSWSLHSISLGTRAFTPAYAECSNGVRWQFKRGFSRMTADFGPRQSDLVGVMSDAGSDVKWMLSTGLGLQWEWRLAHLTIAATKHTFCLESNATSKKLEMTELVVIFCATVRTERTWRPWARCSRLFVSWKAKIRWRA